MRTLILAAAALLAAACGNDSVMSEIERGEKEDAAAEAQAFDAVGRAVQEEAQRLPSGLELQFTRRGHNQSQPQPTENATVLVHYEGALVDGGEVFDSSFARGEPAEFPLQVVVPGFREAITNMRPGDEVVATFPGELGYDAAGQGPIPPNAALRFRILLLAHQVPGGQPVTAQQQ